MVFGLALVLALLLGVATMAYWRKLLLATSPENLLTRAVRVQPVIVDLSIDVLGRLKDVAPGDEAHSRRLNATNAATVIVSAKYAVSTHHVVFALRIFLRIPRFDIIAYPRIGDNIVRHIRVTRRGETLLRGEIDSNAVAIYYIARYLCPLGVLYLDTSVGVAVDQVAHYLGVPGTIEVDAVVEVRSWKATAFMHAVVADKRVVCDTVFGVSHVKAGDARVPVGNVVADPSGMVGVYGRAREVGGRAVEPKITHGHAIGSLWDAETRANGRALTGGAA